MDVVALQAYFRLSLARPASICGLWSWPPLFHSSSKRVLLPNMSSPASGLERFSQILEELAIPSDFARSEYLAENTPIPSLEAWKHKSVTILQEILEILKRIDEDNVTLKTRGDVVFAVAPFTSRQLSALDDDTEDEQGVLQPEPWVTSEVQVLADGRAFILFSLMLLFLKAYLRAVHFTAILAPFSRAGQPGFDPEYQANFQVQPTSSFALGNRSKASQGCWWINGNARLL